MGGGANTGVKIAGWLLGWLAGTMLQLQQAWLWPTLAYGVLLGVGVMLTLPALRWRRMWWCAAIGLACFAFGSTGLRAAARLADALPAELEGQNIVATGVVAALPQTSPAGTRFLFEVEQAEWRGRPVRLPPLLALGWYRDWHDEATLADPRTTLRAGQRWRLTLRLKRPHGSLNPGGFDYELWLFEQGVRATGYVRVTDASAVQLLAPAAGHPVERLRQQVRDAIFARVADPRAAGVLAALSVGDQAAIEREDWDVFRTSGIAHLMSISGLHVTMFAWLAGTLIGGGWRRSARLMLWCPAPWAARWGGVGAAAAYALFSGGGVPSQRTVWMLATAAVLATAGVRWPWLLVLLATGAVVALIDPWALLQVGFWLSFAAVGLLMVSGPVLQPQARPVVPASRWRAAWQGLLRVVREGTRAQAIATLGLAPLSLVFFQQISLIGFVANLAAIPLVTLVITPLALLGVLLPPLWNAAAAVVQGLVAALGWGAAWPAAVWSVPAAPAWGQAAGLLAGALLMMPLPWRWRWLAVPLALPLLWPAVPRPAEGRFELVAADVGQGTAVLVRTQGHTLLYDTGPQYSRDTDAGQRVLLPLLRRRGEPALDLLMLSHSDVDHVGGANAVLSNWPVREISSSLAPGHPLLHKGVPHRPCIAGQSWQWEGVRFSVLHPRAEALAADPAAKPTKPNWLSCVLRIEDAAGHSALLTGDAEAPQEAQMIAADRAQLKAELLLVPHHGSRTSSSAAFLDAVAPRVAIVQAGYRSRFGHPAPDVMQRYAERGIAVMRSDRCGAWSWTAEAAWCERDRSRRYWHFADCGAGGSGSCNAPASP